MANASFVQTSFLGGEWSPRAQGRMTDPAYKTAMNSCLNAFPTEEGMWTRRPGMRFLAHTRGGQTAKIAAFDFTITQPYQIEFTNDMLRLFAGLSLVTALSSDGAVYVSYVSPTNPVKVYLASAVPAGWANGNTVVFRLNSVPATMPQLLNRQFVIANLDTTHLTFTLQDPITGAGVDGTSYTYTTAPAGSKADSVEKVFEAATPWGTSVLPNLRLVTNDTTALILSGTTTPYLLSQGIPWTLAAQSFIDGPYMDINTTTTTLTCSAASGSVNVAASSTTGINGGLGFLSTDVGRLIRIESAPAAWASGTTYAKDAVVTGSDGNIYTAVSGSNTGHDPTTDTGSNWIISSSTVQWVWLKITARTSATVVVATVEAPAPGSTQTTVSASTSPTVNWRLGLYSDTTGWPSCGVFHEGRLWLASTAFGNRVDGSVSNDFFNFSPTDVDGTVAGSNAVSATANASDVNYFFWMLSTEDGLVLGSQSSEWRVRASSLDDPISPSSIQMRRVSNWGCANAEPIQASLNVFVQRHKRKLLAHLQVSDQKYAAENLSHLADHLISSGVEEIRWQQEPPLTIWSRCTDGSLAGTVFQKGYNTWMRTGQAEDSFGAFFGNALGDGRTVESISTGPTYDGLSTTLYAVTNQPLNTAPDYNVRWVQAMMPVFDSSQSDWQAYYTDGGANPSYAQRMAVANGDSFDGIRIFGLWNLNGRTAAPVLGGLDLGDRSIANGYCDVPYLSDPAGKFTQAFFTDLSNGTDYAQWEVTSWYITNSSTVPYAANSLIAFVGNDTSTLIGADGYTCHLDPPNNRVIAIRLAPVSGTTNGGARIINTPFGTEDLQADDYTTFGPATSLGAWVNTTTYNANDVVTGSDGVAYRSLAGSNVGNDPTTDGGVHWFARAAKWSWQGGVGSTVGSSYLHRNGFLYLSGGTSNSAPMLKVNGSTLVLDSSYGTTTSDLTGSTFGRLQTSGSTFAGPRVTNSDGTYANGLVFVGIRAAGVVNEITLINADVLGFMAAKQTDEPMAAVCDGITKDEYSTWYALGYQYTWPGVWAVGTTYASGTQVFGSDSQLYSSVSSGNVGHDPTTDGGVHWTLLSPPLAIYECAIARNFSNGTGFASTFTTRKVVSVKPKDIDATWTSFSAVAGPAFCQIDHTIMFVVFTNDSVTNKQYFVKVRPSDGAILWVIASPVVPPMGNQELSVARIYDHYCWLMTSGGNHTLYTIDMVAGTMTSANVNNQLSDSGHQYYDYSTASITFYGGFTDPGNIPMTYLGTYLPAHSNSFSSNWGRLFTGNSVPASATTTYSIPISIGATYTSQGQLLRPDFGPDAGTQNGPAFGKLRRLHWYGVSMWRSRGMSIGTSFDKLFPINPSSPGKTPILAPTLYSGIVSDTIQDDNSFDAQIAWQVTRPYPLNIQAISGYIQSADK